MNHFFKIELGPKAEVKANYQLCRGTINIEFNSYFFKKIKINKCYIWNSIFKCVKIRT